MRYLEIVSSPKRAWEYTEARYKRRSFERELYPGKQHFPFEALREKTVPSIDRESYLDNPDKPEPRECALIRRMLWRCWHDFQWGNDSYKKEVMDYIATKGVYPFGFLWCCEALEIDPMHTAYCILKPPEAECLCLTDT